MYWERQTSMCLDFKTARFLISNSTVLQKYSKITISHLIQGCESIWHINWNWKGMLPHLISLHCGAAACQHLSVELLVEEAIKIVYPTVGKEKGEFRTMATLQKRKAMIRAKVWELKHPIVEGKKLQEWRKGHLYLAILQVLFWKQIPQQFGEGGSWGNLHRSRLSSELRFCLIR